MITELLTAVVEEKIETVRSLIAEGASVNIENRWDESLIDAAVLSKNIDILKLLLNAGARVNETALQTAVQYNDIEISKLLLDAGADCNFILEEKCSEKCSLLHLAVKSNNLEMTNLLVSAGANVNAQDANYLTPLYFAVTSNNTEISKLLINANADVKLQYYKHHCDLLHHSVRSNNFEISKLLLNAGADYRDSLSLVFETKNLVLLKFFLDFIPNINKKCKDGLAPLQLAAKFGNSSTVKLVIDAGAKIDVEDDFKNTPLYYAVESENIHTFKVLVDAGARVNKRTTFGSTLLHAAACSRDVSILKFLLEKVPGYVNSKDCFGDTPLHMAVRNENVNILKLLIKSGADANKKTHFAVTPPIHLIKMLHHASGKEENKLKRNLNLLIKYCDLNVALSDPTHSIYHSFFDLIDGKLDVYHKKFLQHTAKLKALSISIGSHLLRYVSSENFVNGYFKLCLEELEKTKNIKLRNSWVTYFNLLTDAKSKLVKFAGNENLVDDFNETNFEEKFPIFGEALQRRMSKGICGRKSFDTAASVLSYYVPIFNPSHLVIRDILDTLSRDDWKTLSA